MIEYVYSDCDLDMRANRGKNAFIQCSLVPLFNETGMILYYPPSPDPVCYPLILNVVYAKPLLPKSLIVILQVLIFVCSKIHSTCYFS